jgi:hypothetical protein
VNINACIGADEIQSLGRSELFSSESLPQSGNSFPAAAILAFASRPRATHCVDLAFPEALLNCFASQLHHTRQSTRLGIEGMLESIDKVVRVDGCAQTDHRASLYVDARGAYTRQNAKTRGNRMTGLHRGINAPLAAEEQLR